MKIITTLLTAGLSLLPQYEVQARALIEPTVYVCFSDFTNLDNEIYIVKSKKEEAQHLREFKERVKTGELMDCYHEGGAKGYKPVSSVQECEKLQEDWLDHPDAMAVIISCIPE